MLELVRGYFTAALDSVERDGDQSFAGVLGDLSAVDELLIASEPLRVALTDPSIVASSRAAVLEELLAGKIAIQALRVLTYAVAWERAAELPATVEQLVEIADFARQSAEDGGREVAEPPAGRSGALERLRGYSDWELESVTDPAEIDEIEDELFRLARIVEGSSELRHALADLEVPVERRVALLSELVSTKVQDATARLACYLVRAGRPRDIAGTFNYLAELAARERGRRVAHVRAALELSEDERNRLAAALGRIVRRPVELRVTIDSSVIGGIEVEVGDTVIDGTLRHRLEQLRETLLQRA